MGWRVTAKEKSSRDVVAEYLFDRIESAIKFHAEMVSKGYEVETSRVIV
jgi:hypothetical protein|tara:strand:- start:5086 stop:5232 length:147 start_codon:yes stop_codon:yes gene_type:complete